MSPRIDRLLSGFSGLILALALVAAPADAADGRRKVIIDDDNGFTLMDLLPLEAKDVDVLGLTTVSGDIWANRATAMALRGLEIAGRTDVPVVEGATYPLLNSEVLTDRWEALYGKLTWKGAWMKAWVEPTQQNAPTYHGPHDPVDLPWGNPKTRPLPGTAADFLIQMVHRYPGQVTIIACGPMTNLALAQRLDPDFASLAKELVYMGGSLNPRQMLDNRSAAEFAREYENTPRREFNFRFDPEAASIVLRSPWRKIMAVPVDPSTATQLDKDLLDRMAGHASPALAAFIAKLQPGFPLWDEIAAAVWLDPTLVKDSDTLYLDADTRFGPGYGDMLSWRAGYQPGVGEQQATVIREIDVPRTEALMIRLMANSAR